MSVEFERQGYFRRVPLEPHMHTQSITPASDVIVLCHLGVPRIDARQWTLSVDGLVRRPCRFDLQSLRRYSETEIESVHECAGNPLQPEVPTRRISNVVWRGVRLADVLADCDPNPEAEYVWSHGADFGEFNGVRIPAYVKDLPLGRVSEDVLIAIALNGAPLRPENGYPARLLVPGFYGTNSVKWLTRLALASKRADGPFTTSWYNDPVRDVSGNVIGAKPVWSLAPNSIIASPAPGQSLRLGEETAVRGWAWSDRGVASVKVTLDSGESWMDALVEPRQGRGWQRFTCAFTPRCLGARSLSSCAHDRNDVAQPKEDARNAWHHVPVLIEV